MEEHTTWFHCLNCDSAVTVSTKWGNVTLSIIVSGEEKTFTVWQPHLLQMFEDICPDIFDGFTSLNHMEDTLAESLETQICGKISYQKYQWLHKNYQNNHEKKSRINIFYINY